MVQAVDSISITAPNPPPQEDVINSTLEPMGRAVLFSIEKMFKPEKVAEFRSVFLTRHAIADEIERLLAIMDARKAIPIWTRTSTRTIRGSTMPRVISPMTNPPRQPLRHLSSDLGR